jgi:hypothetical protein
MATLHYGSHLQIHLKEPQLRQIKETVGAHATRGGWVTARDADGGKRLSFLVTAGVPIWIDEDD